MNSLLDLIIVKLSHATDIMSNISYERPLDRDKRNKRRFLKSELFQVIKGENQPHKLWVVFG